MKQEIKDRMPTDSDYDYGENILRKQNPIPIVWNTFFDQKDTGDNYIVLKISHTSICFNVNLLDFSSRDFKNTSLVQPLKY